MSLLRGNFSSILPQRPRGFRSAGRKLIDNNNNFSSAAPNQCWGPSCHKKRRWFVSFSPSDIRSCKHFKATRSQEWQFVFSRPLHTGIQFCFLETGWTRRTEKEDISESQSGFHGRPATQTILRRTCDITADLWDSSLFWPFNFPDHVRSKVLRAFERVSLSSWETFEISSFYFERNRRCEKCPDPAGR